MRRCLLLLPVLALCLSLTGCQPGSGSDLPVTEVDAGSLDYLIVQDNSKPFAPLTEFIISDLDNNGISECITVMPIPNSSINVQPYMTISDAYLEGGGQQTNFPDAEKIQVRPFDLDGDGKNEILVNKLRHDSLFIEILTLLGEKVIKDFFLISGVPRSGYDWECIAIPMEINRQPGDTTLVFWLDIGYSYQPRGLLLVRYPSGTVLDSLFVGAHLSGLKCADIDQDGLSEFYGGSYTPDNCQGRLVNGTDDRHTYFMLFEPFAGSFYYETLGGISSGSAAYPLSDEGNPNGKFWFLYSRRNQQAPDSSFLAIYDYSSRQFLKKIKFAESILITATQYDYNGDNRQDLVLTKSNGQMEIRDQQLELLLSKDLGQHILNQWFFDLDQDGRTEIFIFANRMLYMFSEKFKLLAKAQIDAYDIHPVRQGNKHSLFVHGNGVISWLTLQPNLIMAERYRRTWLKAMFSSVLLLAISLLTVRWYKRQQIPYLAHHALQNLEIPGVLIIDQQGRLRQMNEKARLLMQLSAEQQGWFYQKIPNELMKELAPHIDKCFLRTDKEAQQIQTIPALDASPNLQVFFKPLRTTSGRFRGVLMILEDRSEKIQALRAMAWSTMAQRLAHQIKTPLSSVLLSVQRLQMEYIKDGAGKAKDYDRYVEYVNNEVGRIRHALDGLLKLARLEKPALRTCNINDLVRLALQKFEPYLNAGIELETLLDISLPLILVDENQIVILLTLLIENSIDAMPQGGWLRIATRLAHDLHKEKGKSEPETIEVIISDNGIGIAEEKLDKLFEPFYTNKPNGTGLGLPIAKKIIEDHAGNIKINSKEKMGTQVTVQLPINE